MDRRSLQQLPNTAKPVQPAADATTPAARSAPGVKMPPREHSMIQYPEVQRMAPPRPTSPRAAMHQRRLTKAQQDSPRQTGTSSGVPRPHLPTSSIQPHASPSLPTFLNASAAGQNTFAQDTLRPPPATGIVNVNDLQYADYMNQIVRYPLQDGRVIETTLYNIFINVPAQQNQILKGFLKWWLGTQGIAPDHCVTDPRTDFVSLKSVLPATNLSNVSLDALGTSSDAFGTPYSGALAHPPSSTQPSSPAYPQLPPPTPSVSQATSTTVAAHHNDGSASSVPLDYTSPSLCVPLHISDDDVAQQEQYIHEMAQQYLDALPAGYEKVPRDIVGNAVKIRTHFETQENGNEDVLEKLNARNIPVHALIGCTKMTHAVIGVNKIGVPEFVEGTFKEQGTKQGNRVGRYTLDICSVRHKKVLEAIIQNKWIAMDVLKGHACEKIARDAEFALETKIRQANSNARRGRRNGSRRAPRVSFVPRVKTAPRALAAKVTRLPSPAATSPSTSSPVDTPLEQPIQNYANLPGQDGIRQQDFDNFNLVSPAKVDNTIDLLNTVQDGNLIAGSDPHKRKANMVDGNEDEDQLQKEQIGPNPNFDNEASPQPPAKRMRPKSKPSSSFSKNASLSINGKTTDNINRYTLALSNPAFNRDTFNQMTPSIREANNSFFNSDKLNTLNEAPINNSTISSPAFDRSNASVQYDLNSEQASSGADFGLLDETNFEFADFSQGGGGACDSKQTEYHFDDISGLVNFDL